MGPAASAMLTKERKFSSSRVVLHFGERFSKTMEARDVGPSKLKYCLIVVADDAKFADEILLYRIRIWCSPEGSRRGREAAERGSAGIFAMIFQAAG